MERDFPSFHIAGEGNTAFPPVFDTRISDMSFQSLVSSNQDITLMSSPECNYKSSFISPPVNFGFLNDNFSAISSNQIDVCSTDGNQKWKSVDFTAKSKLKMPKQEPLEPSFHQLPDLRSFEHVPGNFAVAESSQKRIKSISTPTLDPYSLDSILSNFQITKCFSAGKTPENRPPQAIPQSVQARERRQKISDKTRCLQKLLPWDKKMDMATMLEEAYKYIKFLQAQISVLQSMPYDSSSFPTQNPRNLHVFGGLENLNRQQLLQVLVNSPVAQTTLYSQGCCVYSIEQVAFLKKMMEKKYAYQQIAFDPSMLP